MITPKYFILNEAEGDRCHIGTVVASYNEELKRKAIEAIEAHFDCELKTIQPLSINEIRQSHSGSFEFNATMLDVACGAEEPDSRKIEILETWLY